MERLHRSHQLVALADGASFAGWEGDTARTWRIENGAFVGRSLLEKIPRNEVLATERIFINFVLQLEFKLEGPARTWSIPGSSSTASACREAVKYPAGYQADLGDPAWWGSLYDESRRNRTLASSDMAPIAPALRREDWNVHQIQAFNGCIQTWRNGVAGVDYREPDPEIPQWGRIGLQIHGGGPAWVSFRNITLEELPPPADR